MSLTVDVKTFVLSYRVHGTVTTKPDSSVWYSDGARSEPHALCN
jgi:hypothetical protein